MLSESPIPPCPATTQWSVWVTETTDRALRDFLAQADAPKDAWSHFIEDAVQERLAALTVQKVRARNRAIPQETIIDDVTSAVRAVRAHCS